MRTRPTPVGLALLACLLVLSTLTGVRAAADTVSTVITLTGPPEGTSGDPAPFAVTVTNDAGPVVGAPVTLEQQNADSTWRSLPDQGVTDATGSVEILARLPRGSATFRATSDGVSSPEVVATGRYPSTLGLAAPVGLLTAGTRTLQLAWTAADDSPVAGEVTLSRRLGTGAWSVFGSFDTDEAGLLSVAVPSRSAWTWRASGTAGPWWSAADSPLLDVDLMPRAVLPTGAPQPAYTPPQSRATGAGANAVVTTIPAAVWTSMIHRSWHRGCPVGRAQLLLLRVNYWGFDGLRYRGEMVLNRAVAYRAAGALRWMYDRGYPIRRMYRVDRFGWSRKLRGANDYASMAADNTSAFNCRSVVNKPWVRSPHATGRSVDLNTWENPYRSRTGLVPNSWWAPRSDPLVAWRSSTHPVVAIWRAWGFRWTYATADSQHVDGRTLPPIATFSG